MHVTLIAAITIDGLIGRSSDQSSFEWTSMEDKQHYVQYLKQSDAIVMGLRTFETFSKYPKGSDWYLYTRSPHKFSNPKPEVISAQTVQSTPQELISQLQAQGRQKVLIAGGAEIYTMFMEASLVDELVLTIEPVIFGQGVSLFSRSIPQEAWQRVETRNLSDQTIVQRFTKTTA